MPEAIEPDLHALIGVLARQAYALDRLFMRAVGALLWGNERSLRDMSRALTAQHQCRTAFRLLLALCDAVQAEKKIAKSNERTIERGNSPS